MGSLPIEFIMGIIAVQIISAFLFGPWEDNTTPTT
tara:strand:- start:217 stop:321 length:105 start_codon:yes stop_codon:yes gene_type:complete